MKSLCINVEIVDLSNTAIRIIPDFVLKLPKLRVLNYLGCDKLQKQPNLTYCYEKLEKLFAYFGENQVENICFDRFLKLNSLTINGIIYELPYSICKCINLKELSIFDTSISTLPHEIEFLLKLKKISIWQSLFSEKDIPVQLDLREIFIHLSKCQKLTILELERNDISEMPPNINLLSKLQILNVSHNRLNSFPREIFDLVNLKELNFGVNQLKYIPKGIESLKKLRILKLNSNWKNKINLSNLYSVICNLSNLEILELWGCVSSKDLPESIVNLKKLKKIDLDNNKLVRLPRSILQMTHLEVLRISTNNISLDEIDTLKKYLLSTNIIY